MRDMEYGGPFNEMPLDHIRRFIGAYDSGLFSDVPVLDRKYNHVIVAGMGGSGIVGSAIVDLARNVTDVPVDVLRANRLPAHISENTLVLVISYSGNTREMLELYSECISKGCKVIVITTGGRLEELAREDGTYLLVVDGGFTPRSDIGFAIGYAAAVIDSNCGTHIMDSFVSAMRVAEPYALMLSDFEASDNQARCIAMRISSKTPFIYGGDEMACVVNRWKCQINENAKVPAACNTFPEFNHNSLEGWCGNSYNSLIPLFLGDTDPYIDVASDVMGESGNSFLFVRIPGDSVAERMINGVVLGDYVSLYLAQILGVDDSPVYAITEFKKRTKDL